MHVLFNCTKHSPMWRWQRKQREFDACSSLLPFTGVYIKHGLFPSCSSANINAWLMMQIATPVTEDNCAGMVPSHLNLQCLLAGKGKSTRKHKQGFLWRKENSLLPNACFTGLLNTVKANEILFASQAVGRKKDQICDVTPHSQGQYMACALLACICLLKTWHLWLKQDFQSNQYSGFGQLLAKDWAFLYENVCSSTAVESVEDLFSCFYDWTYEFDQLMAAQMKWCISLSVENF